MGLAVEANWSGSTPQIGSKNTVISLHKMRNSQGGGEVSIFFLFSNEKISFHLSFGGKKKMVPIAQVTQWVLWLSDRSFSSPGGAKEQLVPQHLPRSILAHGS